MIRAATPPTEEFVLKEESQSFSFRRGRHVFILESKRTKDFERVRILKDAEVIVEVRIPSFRANPNPWTREVAHAFLSKLQRKTLRLE